VTVNEMPEATETPTESTEAVTETTATTESTATTATATPAEADEVRARRKVREGTVVSNKMDKTAVVAVVDRVRHAKYNKFVLRTKKLYCHDEANDVNIGDKVRVMETRPLSKNKRWRVTEVLERAK
jgi:small subunit ribosomal protein S17